jgi:hypothetical protein
MNVAGFEKVELPLTVKLPVMFIVRLVPVKVAPEFWVKLVFMSVPLPLMVIVPLLVKVPSVLFVHVPVPTVIVPLFVK